MFITHDRRHFFQLFAICTGHGEESKDEQFLLCAMELGLLDFGDDDDTDEVTKFSTAIGCCQALIDGEIHWEQEKVDAVRLLIETRERTDAEWRELRRLHNINIEDLNPDVFLQPALTGKRRRKGRPKGRATEARIAELANQVAANLSLASQQAPELPENSVQEPKVRRGRGKAREKPLFAAKREQFAVSFYHTFTGETEAAISGKVVTLLGKYSNRNSNFIRSVLLGQKNLDALGIKRLDDALTEKNPVSGLSAKVLGE